MVDGVVVVVGGVVGGVVVGVVVVVEPNRKKYEIKPESIK